VTIAKHLKANKAKSEGRRGSSHVKGLVTYLRKGDQQSRVEFVHFDGFNLASDQEQDIDVATLEMAALADANPRCANPLLHAMVSWPEDERPTEKQAQEAVAIVLAELGADGLQHIYAAHVDTQNFHLHIVVNRIDPESEKPRRLNNGFHQEALLRASARIDSVQGWSRPKKAIYDLTESGEAVRRDAQRDPARPSIPAGLHDQEIKTGTKSAVRIAQEQVADILLSAESWPQLHTSLSAIGARYEKKGSGALVWISNQPVKASSVSRRAALGEMAKRLGEYEPAANSPDQAARHIPPVAQPINATAAALSWSEYHRERENFFQKKRQTSAQSTAQFAAERRNLFERQAAERHKISARDWRRQGAVLNALRQLVAFEHAKQKAAMVAGQKEQRRASRAGRFPNFEEWVDQKHGRAAADLYRHSARLVLITGPATERLARDIRDYRAENIGGAIRYIDRAGHTGFIDTGRRIAVIDVSDEGTLAALQLAQVRYGARLHVHGPADWVERAIRIAVENNITIANPNLQNAIKAERQRQEAESRKLPASAPVLAQPELDDFVDMFSDTPEPVAPPPHKPAVQVVAEILAANALLQPNTQEIPAEIPEDQPTEPVVKTTRRSKTKMR
jgi:hypothetical protein